MGIKNWFIGVKKDWETKKEIGEIKKQSYIKEMKTQASVMGKRQARIEAEHREKMYIKKLNDIGKKQTIKNNKPVDVFGFNKELKGGKTFNIITGKYE